MLELFVTVWVIVSETCLSLFGLVFFRSTPERERIREREVLTLNLITNITVIRGPMSVLSFFRETSAIRTQLKFFGLCATVEPIVVKSQRSTAPPPLLPSPPHSTSFTRFGANVEDVNQNLKPRLAFYWVKGACLRAASPGRLKDPCK